MCICEHFLCVLVCVRSCACVSTGAVAAGKAAGDAGAVGEEGELSG